MPKHPDLKYRFVIGTPETRRSGHFRIWTTKNEIYLSGRNLGGQFKVSFHKDGNRFAGYTSEYKEKLLSLGLWFLPRRDIDRWKNGVELKNSLFLEFNLFFPESQLRSHHDQGFKPSEYDWLPPPKPGEMTQVSLVLEKNFEHNTSLTNLVNGDYSIIKSHVLENGQDRLWLSHSIASEPQEKHPQEDLIYKQCMAVFKGDKNAFLVPNRRVMLWSKSNTGLRSWYDFAADSFYRKY